MHWLICDLLRPNKKIPVFRVTQPYLNLLVKPRICFRFSEKKNNFMHFESQNAFQNAFSGKINKKNICLPYHKFSGPLPETCLFYDLALLHQTSGFAKA